MIRDATVEDAASIAGLITELGYPTTESEMLARLKALATDDSNRTLVAEMEGRVAGVAGVAVGLAWERDGLHGRLMALAITASYRRHGVGRALLRAAEDWVRSRGADVMMVTTRHTRADAHAFYRSMGYESTGLRFVRELE